MLSFIAAWLSCCGGRRFSAACRDVGPATESDIVPAVNARLLQASAACCCRPTKKLSPRKIVRNVVVGFSRFRVLDKVLQEKQTTSSAVISVSVFFVSILLQQPRVSAVANVLQAFFSHAQTKIAVRRETSCCATKCTCRKVYPVFLAARCHSPRDSDISWRNKNVRQSTRRLWQNIFADPERNPGRTRLCWTNSCEVLSRFSPGQLELIHKRIWSLIMSTFSPSRIS